MAAIRVAICAMIVLPLAFLAAGIAHADAGGDLRPNLALHVSPATIEIGVNYAGANEELAGTAPVGSQVAVVVSTAPTSSFLSKKDKVLGVLWMNTESVKVENAPVVYLVYTSAPLGGLLPPGDPLRAELDSSGPVAGASVVDAEGGASITAAEAKEYLDGLCQIRLGEGLYGLHEGGVTLHDGAWQVPVALPSTAPPGDYQVTAYAIADNTVVGKAVTDFTIEKSGVVSLLANMAHNSPSVYGGMSILLAGTIGLGVARLFSKGRN